MIGSVKMGKAVVYMDGSMDNLVYRNFEQFARKTGVQAEETFFTSDGDVQTALGEDW